MHLSEMGGILGGKIGQEVDKGWTKSGQIENKTSKSGQKVDKLKTKQAKVDSGQKWTSYGEYGWQGGHFGALSPILGVAGEGALGAPPKWGQFGKYGPAIT